MKARSNAIALLAIFCGMVLGCTKVEKVLPHKDGLWDVKTVTYEHYENDSLIERTGGDENLPYYFFDADGTGYYKSFYFVQRFPFTWSVNDDNDQLTIQDTTSTQPTVWDIVEHKRNAETWVNTTVATDSGVTVRQVWTYTLEQ